MIVPSFASVWLTVLKKTLVLGSEEVIAAILVMKS